jgi:hypothetical protein
MCRVLPALLQNIKTWYTYYKAPQINKYGYGGQPVNKAVSQKCALAPMSRAGMCTSFTCDCMCMVIQNIIQSRHAEGEALSIVRCRTPCQWL